MNFESIREKLGLTSPAIEREDGIWVHTRDLNVQRMASIFGENNARLITMVAQPAQNGEFRVLYHWDVDGATAHLSTETQGGQIESIASICPAANWIEREIHDYYGILFRGRDDLPPLILRSGDQPGLFFGNGKPTEREK
jgi:NADH:ubiquinone oxidoreductase subunit C